MRKLLSVFTATIILLLGFTSCDSGAPSAKVTIDGTKFMVNNEELWINGVNTPWQNWNDFNGGMEEQFWDETFEQLASDGVNCTRIWINCEGMGTVQLGPTGAVTSVNEQHWTDLDKLFSLAEKHKVYIMPTLLSFDHFSSEYWQKMLLDHTAADTFVEQYVVEFAKRYGDKQYLFGIDLMNEPDWVFENSENGNIPWEDLSYFFGKCAAAIHKNCTALVTVGIGIIKYNSDSYDGNMISDEYMQELTGDADAYVDFYSTHYYMWQKQWFGFPFEVTPEEFGLDGTKPCVIGEASNDSAEEIGMTLTEQYRTAYEKGWNGVMVWMENRTDGTSGCDYNWYRYDLTREATLAMAELIPDKINPLGK